MATNSTTKVVSDLWLFHPVLTTTFINNVLSSIKTPVQITTQNGGLQNNDMKNGNHKNNPPEDASMSVLSLWPLLHVVFQNEACKDKRLDIVRHVFPRGACYVMDASIAQLLLAMFGNSSNDPDYSNDAGKLLFAHVQSHSRHESVHQTI